MRPTLITGALVTVIAIAGCGGGDEPDGLAAADSPAGGTAVEVVAEDIQFDETSYLASAGTVDLQYRNDGSIKHTLVIDDVEDLKLELAGNGDEDEGAVDLEAGTYTFYCDVPGHRAAGMEATLEVG